MLEIDLSTQEAIREHFDNDVPDEIKEEFNLVSMETYHNYEREAMSQIDGYLNLINIVKKGKDVVLKDSYYTGGWFGAS